MNDEMLRGCGTSYFFAGVITCNFTDIFSYSVSLTSFLVFHSDLKKEAFEKV